VDALWLKKKGCSKPEHFEDVMHKISSRTGLAIALDGIYRWVAFLPSKTDPRVPIPNRYFGVFQSGEIKVRGLEARRRDTPRWIAQVQTEMLTCLGQAKTRAELPEALHAAFQVYEQSVRKLKQGQVPPELLVVNGKVSYALEAYKSATASVRAARQLQAAGMQIRPGQRVRFLFMQGEPDVYAWELGGQVDPAKVDQHKYLQLLAKAGGSVLLPFGIDPQVLMEWTLKGGIQLPLDTWNRALLEV
jgi:DNA polymerase-2